jgi:hypothetical protein
MIWLLAKLVPVREVAAIGLILLGLSYAGVDVVGIALDLLGVPDWRWTGLDLATL